MSARLAADPGAPAPPEPWLSAAASQIRAGAEVRWTPRMWLSPAAAVLLLLAVVGLSVFGAAMPLADRAAALDEEIAELETQLDRFSDAAARAWAQEKIEVAEPALFEAASRAAAGAALQAMVGGAVDASGGSLERFRFDSAQPEDAQLAADADITVPADALHRLLHQLETARPYLFIEAASLRPARGSQTAAGVTVRLRLVGRMGR